jgi:hypothetical protein
MAFMLLPWAKDAEAGSSDDTICRRRGISSEVEAGVEVASTIRHTYRPGEEVVLRLAGVDVHNIERGTRVDGACLPAWTIGVVIACAVLEGEAAYVMRVDHDGCTCVCLALQASIEGVA